MLKHLSVKNFALIDDLSIDFEKGFNVLSGETGSGKTLLVNALKIVLGEKVSKKYIRHGQEFAEISAEFEVESKELIKDLEENGISLNKKIIIRRKISKSGGKIFINDTLVGLQLLKSISKKMVKITSQFENQFILEKNNQFKILDSFSKINDLVDKYRDNFSEYQFCLEKLNELIELNKEKKQKIDYLLFQKKEIEDLNLDLEQAKELSSFLNKLENKNEVSQLISQGYEGVYGDNGILNQVENLNDMIRELNKKDKDLNLSTIKTDEFDNLGKEIEQAQNSYEIDEDQISEVIEKKENINNLEKKYGSIDEIFSFYEKNEKEIEKLNSVDEDIELFREKKESLSKKMKKQTTEITLKRKENSKKLSKAVEKELQDLNMVGTKFKIEISTGEFNNLGANGIRFLISPNIGEPFLEMEEIVSGGELSRILLILSKYLHDEKNITYVFDEVDAGIGGETGLLVGKKLSNIGSKNQVLCITHLAQVAAKADVHYFIMKEVKDKRTVSVVKKLEKEDRIKEMARLIYGTVDKKSLEFAKSLLK